MCSLAKRVIVVSEAVVKEKVFLVGLVSVEGFGPPFGITFMKALAFSRRAAQLGLKTVLAPCPPPRVPGRRLTPRPHANGGRSIHCVLRLPAGDGAEGRSAGFRFRCSIEACVLV